MRVLIFLVAVVMASAAIADVGRWSGVGPSGGQIGKVEFHRTNPSIAYANGDGGFFRSLDGGVNWRPAETGLPSGVFFPLFEQAPNNGNIVYLAVREPRPTLYRSSNAGASWNVLPPIAPSGPKLLAFSVSPNDPDRIAVLLDNNTVRLSSNGGLNYTTVGGAFPGRFSATQVAIFGTLILVGGLDDTDGNSLVFRSINNGASFAPTSVINVPGSGDDFIANLRFAPSTANVAYAALFGSTFRTIDGGGNWTRLATVNLDLRFSYWSSLTNPQDLIWARGDRLYRSTSGGDSVSFLGTTTEPTLQSVSAIPGFPTVPTLLAGTTGRGVIRSTNNGATWNDSFAGLRSFNARALAIPFNSPNRVFAAQGDAGYRAQALQVSNDGGNTWAPNSLSNIANSVRGLAFDPTSAGQTLYAVGRLFWLLPDNTFGAAQNGGIYKSIDAGANWTVNSTGIPVSGAGRSMGLVRAVVLDPRSCDTPPPAGPCTSGPLRTLYVLGSGRSNFIAGGWVAAMLYKSVDAGATWLRADTGLPSPAAGTQNQIVGVSLVIDPINPNTLYAGFAASYTNIATPGGVIAGVYKTTDGGAIWRPVSSGMPVRGSGLPPDILALAIHPQNPQILYASVTNGDFPGAPQAGIYKSVNGGSSWSNASNGVVGADVRALLVDRDNPSTVYAGSIGTLSSPGGVYKTTNSGGQWLSISGNLTSGGVLALARDPADPATLYAGASNGVWQLTQVPDEDGDGAGSAIENAGPNGGDGNGDGLLDSAQTNVASAINEPINNALTRGRINYISMTGGAGLIEEQAPKTKPEAASSAAACEQLTDVYSIDPRVYPPDPRGVGQEFDHDEFGVVSVELPDCREATITIKFHAGAFAGPNWTWRNYGPTTPGDDSTVGWYQYADAEKLNATTWRIRVRAGQRGSWRANPSSILFRGGPSFFDAQANAKTVTKTADTNDGVCNTDCSLREAIAAATPGDVITFGTLFTSQRTIALSNGELDIAKDLTIQGPGANLLTITGNGSGRVFYVRANSVVRLRGITITGAANTGIIVADASLTLEDVNLVGNTGSSYGGLVSLGDDRYRLDIINSTIANNIATDIVGFAGIFSSSRLYMVNSTVSGNSVNNGLRDSTGGVHSEGGGSIINSTITNNYAIGARSGSGLASRNRLIRVRNSIIAGNRGDNDLYANGAWIVSDGYNLIGNRGNFSFNATGDQSGTATALLRPRLDVLRDNAGPTLTHRVFADSPALDRGQSSGSSTDQRGLARPVDLTPPNAASGDGADIGAVEMANLVTDPDLVFRNSFE